MGRLRILLSSAWYFCQYRTRPIGISLSSADMERGVNATKDRMPTESDGMSGLLVRLSRLALVATLVKKAQIAVDTIPDDTAVGLDIRGWLARSKGLFVAPDVLPGALIPGGACSGVFMARAPNGNDWNGPTFHMLSGVALGLEPGGPSSAIFLLAMTDRGVGTFLSNNIELGERAVIVAPGTANDDTGIVGFALSEGARSSPFFEGAVITRCDGLNRAVYGPDVTPADILIRGTPRGIDSAGLTRALVEAASE